MLTDNFGRVIKDLRISVTDRCNFKCTYCKTARGVRYVERDKVLSYEEILRLSRIFAELGIRKIRITGGEPLLRRELENLIAGLSQVEQIGDLALTTNGFNFYRKAEKLKAAGLKRITISLDSLREDRFFQITRSREFGKVLKSIEAARKWDFRPVKINCVVVRGFNDDEIPEFARFARDHGLAVRFIEFMPLDEDEQWNREQVVTGEEMLERLQNQFELVDRPSTDPSETSRNFDFPGSEGSIGLITTVSRPFCGECSRIRLTADGKIRTCLFSMVEHDVKERLRGGAGDAELREFIKATALKKESGHKINEPDFVPPPRTMSYIGG